MFKSLCSFIFFLGFSFQLLAQDTVLLFSQRTYQKLDIVQRSVQSYDEDQTAEASRSDLGLLISDEVVEVAIWYGSEDTFARALVYDRPEFEQSASRSQSRAVPNLTSDIPWRGPQTRDNVFNAFNYGRDHEAVQLGKNLTPMTESEAVGNEFSLFLANDDRTARGILPFQSLESNVQEIAESHLEDMLENNFFDHTGSDGKSPFGRIDDHPVIGNGASNSGQNCHDFLPRSENLAAYWTSRSSVPISRARAQYAWVYDDASSAWGHRETSLLANRDLRGRKGFVNDHGDSESEGLVGFAVGGSSSYNPFSFSWSNYGEIVVFNIIDPVPSCTYDIIDNSPIQRFGAEVQNDSNVLLSLVLDTSFVFYDAAFERRMEDGDWEHIAEVAPDAPSQSLEIMDLDPGLYDFRVVIADSKDNLLFESIHSIEIAINDEDIDVAPDTDPGSLNASIQGGSLVIETNIPLILVFVDGYGRMSRSEYKPGDSYPLDGLGRGVYFLILQHRTTGENLRVYRLFIN